MEFVKYINLNNLHHYKDITIKCIDIYIIDNNIKINILI
jgi:hypothetical protein